MRSDWLTFLALDDRLGRVVRTAREPILAQIKLAWWRDRLGADPAGWPKGEPLLARLAGWEERTGLVALVDGWEALLEDLPHSPQVSERFAHGRAGAIGVLAARMGENTGDAMNIAKRWALAERGLAGLPAGHRDADSRRAKLPGTMRPLAVLAGLHLRAARRGDGEVLSGPGALLAAIRLGMTGRPA